MVVEDLLELSRIAQALSEEGSVYGGDRPRVPKYLRLSDSIAGAVEAGELKPGERLPGESELAEMQRIAARAFEAIDKGGGRIVEQGTMACAMPPSPRTTRSYRPQTASGPSCSTRPAKAASALPMSSAQSWSAMARWGPRLSWRPHWNRWG